MHARHVIAVVIVFVIALGAKSFLFPSKQAVAGSVAGATMNVLQMHRELDSKDLPLQKIRDKTFVFENE